jgi:ABC-type glycerol-3-phosphate transport system substrate-binding protein
MGNAAMPTQNGQAPGKVSMSGGWTWAIPKNAGNPDKAWEFIKLTVSIYTFFSQYAQVVYGQLAAYSMLYSLPAVLLYLVLSRRLSVAFTFGGAVKG